MINHGSKCYCPCGSNYPSYHTPGCAMNCDFAKKIRHQAKLNFMNQYFNEYFDDLLKESS